MTEQRPRISLRRPSTMGQAVEKPQDAKGVLHALIALADGLLNDDGEVGFLLRVAGFTQIHEHGDGLNILKVCIKRTLRMDIDRRVMFVQKIKNHQGGIIIISCLIIKF